MGRRAVTLFEAIVLGVVEGVTEYLPVSSTGHLILTSELLELEGERVKTFEVVIQLGAILAVLVHYRRLLGARLAGLIQGRPEALRLFGALIVAFLPAAVVGLLLHKVIKSLLFGPLPVAVAMVVGGVLMILVERIRAKRGIRGEDGVDKVTYKRALLIGVGQCFSLWPGASRSMCTIVAGQLAGLSTATAADFAFLLGLPTLGAATVYDFYKGHQLLLAGSGWLTLVTGTLVSFVVAWAVIAAFVRYLQKRGLEPFGYYRIALGLVVVWVTMS